MKPRIVHVYKDYWPPILGGVERCINWMCQALKNDFDFTVLVNSRCRETKERDVEGVRVIEVGEWGRFQSAPLSPAFPGWLKKLKTDVWHFHLPNPTGDFSYLLSRPKGKVVATYHSDVIRQRWAMAAYGPFLHAFLRRCDVIMPTSPRQLEFSPVLQKHKNRCEPLPLGMPMDGFERTAERGLAVREIKRLYSGRPILSFIGRLRYYKGLHLALDALQQIPDAVFLIIGEGPEKVKLQALAEELRISDRVKFLDELSDEDCVRNLMASELFLLPSHLSGEVFGLSQVEAMACGVPVVCFDLPTGVPWVNQDGVTGRVVPLGNVDAFAEAVRYLLGNHPKRMQMGEAAHRRARAEFSQQVMGDRLKSVYTRVLAKEA